MPILGGSPLGLIGVMSGPTRDGMSTFNGGRSRNVNVNLYNAGKEGDKEKISKSKVDKGDKGGAFSIFTGGNFNKPWANIQTDPNSPKPKLEDSGYTGISRKTLHNNDVYDTSLLNIIEKTAGTRCRLRPTDFAYLKDIGVYPNNRLIIARRFDGPVADDIWTSGKSPISVLVTWRKPEEDFLEISFGEVWEEAKADFTDMLNNISNDILGKKVGGSLAGGLGAVPIPGWSEGLQDKILQIIGVKEKKLQGDQRLPAGNPNLIKQAKRRKTVPYGEAGSGLKCSISIKMEVEYEQKFISGIDTTIVFQDIISNILRFGTSPSVDWGLSKGFATKLVNWTNNPSSMVTDIYNGVTDAMIEVKEKVIEGLSSVGGGTASAPEWSKDTVTKALDDLIDEVKSSFSRTIQKYIEEVKGITRSLTGLPSTPWHVTIGNPLRPTFCSGDLYMESDLTLSFGPNLAFNDLPATIKASFTLQNARPWGLQEIMGKFNTGNLRTVNVMADSSNLRPGSNLSDGPYVYTGNKNETGLSSSVLPTNPSSGQVSTSNNVNPGQSASSTTKDGQNNSSVNTDPNATGPIVENDPTKKTKVDGNVSQSGTVGEKQKQETDTKTDPVADANATSKLGYTYEQVKEGIDKSYIRVKDKNGVVVVTMPSTTTDVKAQIEEAKLSVNDK